MWVFAEDALVTLTGGDVTDEVALLVVEVLKVQMQRVDLGLCFLRLLLGAASLQDSATVQPA